MQLSTNLTRERLQIDTDLLLIITSTADDLSEGTNIDDLDISLNPKIWGFSEFFVTSGCDAHLYSEILRKLLENEDRPRQPSHEIKLMLSCVSWALAQISCYRMTLLDSLTATQTIYALKLHWGMVCQAHCSHPNMFSMALSIHIHKNHFWNSCWGCTVETINAIL